MPDPAERIVPEGTRSGFPGAIAKLLPIVVGASLSVAFVYLGLSSIGVNRLFSIPSEHPPAELDRMEPGPDAANGAETLEQLLVRMCRAGPDYISECRLLREQFCNQPALQAAMLKLEERNNYPAAAKLGTAFLDRCDLEEAIGLLTAQAFYRITDFEAALRTIDRFPEQAAGYADYASWRGFTNEKLGRYDGAADDYERALYGFFDLSRVAGPQFYYVTRVLKAAGRYCEAIAPLKLFVSFDPAGRKSTQIDRELAELRRLGKCKEDVAPGRQVITLQRAYGVLLVDAKINGVHGRFILDTGASTVHLTRDFARSAAILISEKRRIRNQGVTGSRLDYLSDIPHVAVEGFIARNVTATVASDNSSMGAGIDGLLGQTFLSRFRYSIDGERLTLRPM